MKSFIFTDKTKLEAIQHDDTVLRVWLKALKKDMVSDILIQCQDNSTVKINNADERSIYFIR